MKNTDVSINVPTVPVTHAENIEKQQEAERLHDVLLLLEHLCQREAITIKIILGCLYDIGATNLINHKVPLPILRGPLKLITRTSKPVFVVIGLQWFKRYCPQLITDWLYSLVQFQPVPEGNALVMAELQEEATAQLREATPIPQLAVSQQTSEVRRLQGQVQILAASLVVVTGALSIAILG